MNIFARRRIRRTPKYNNSYVGCNLSEYIEQIKWKEQGLILKTTYIREEYLEMKKRLNK